MSKFLSGRQSNLKLGVAGYTESKTVLETTGKVGIGTTDAQQHSLFVVGSTNITGDTTVGSAITMYASTGIISATAFHGDGSNLANTGATLSAAAGTQRLVVTSLTSGTMVDAATDGDLTFNATTNTLNTDNLIVAGNLTVSGDQTILNTTSLEVEDINIGIASANPKLNDAQLNGAGITIHGLNGDKTLTWDNSNSRLSFNTNLYAPNFFVGGITASGDVDIDGHTELDQLRVSGVSTFQSNVHLLDNDKLLFGDDDDLQIYHDTNNSYIKDNGTGSLRILGGNTTFMNAAETKTSATFNTASSVDLYYDNSLKFQTTGYGATVYNDLNVGTGVTIYGNAGIVSATSFYGDGSNLTNTGATLSATSGIERLVTTQLTSGTMVDAGTDGDLTFDAVTNTLSTQNIQISGGISTNGITYGQDGQLLKSTGTGWEWRTVPGIFSVNNILNGFNVLEEGSQVGTAGSIHTLDFRGINVTATADPAPNGIATVTFSPTPTFTDLTVLNNTTLGGAVSAGGTVGTDGQYLKSTGVGVTWASFPTLRVVGVNTATAGQTAFNFSYNVDFLDVFVNGVKLTPSEYTATNGNQIVLKTPAFANEIVEFHSYNITSNYGGGGGGGGGGASNLDGLNDVTIGTLTDKDLLQYQSSSGEWENVSVNSLPYATEAFVGLSTAGLASETFVGLSTAGLASESYVNTQVGLATAGLASEAFVGLATAGLLTAHQSLIGKANVTIGDNPPGIGTASGDLWWESDTAKGHIYYDDGSSAQWVEFNPSSGGGGGGGGSYGNADVDSHLNVSGASSGQILSWNGSDYAWVADQTGGGGGISTHDVRTNSLEVYTGVSTFVGYAATFAAQFKNNVFIDAGAYAMFGNSIDKFSIRNTVGKSQLISGQNGGNVEILSQQSGSVIKIGKYSGGANDIALFTVDAGVELFHNTAKKFETTSTGANVTGVLTATSFSGSGSALTGLTGASAGTFGDGSNVAAITVDSNGRITGISEVSISGGGSGGISNVVDDATPQLGGDLDLNSNDISGSGTISATKIITSKWTLGANGSSDYTFTGPGLTGTVNDPTIYLIRGQSYHFVNNMGAHPFRIQSTPNGSAGTAYNTGVTNNNVSNGTLTFDVPFDAPDVLYYQCTAHPNMGGKIVITAPPKRFTTSASTGSIAAAATQDITIAGCETYALLKIQTSHAAWVRLYTDTTSRTNDASRAYTTDPTPGSGVLAEVYSTSSGSNTFKMSPGVIGWNDDGTPSSNIYAKVTNNESGSADVTVTLTIVRMED